MCRCKEGVVNRAANGVWRHRSASKRGGALTTSHAMPRSCSWGQPRAHRSKDIGVGTAGRPALRLNSIVLNLIIETEKTGGQLSLRITHLLLVDLHLLVARNRIASPEVWLKGLLGGAGEFGKQWVAGGVGNHTVTIGATGLPQNVPTSVEHLEIQERAAEAHSRREVVTGKILNPNICQKLSAVFGCGVECHLRGRRLRQNDRSVRLAPPPS